MHIVRIFPTAILAALGGYAIGMAGPALADDSLNGHYQAIVDGSRSDPLGGLLIVNTNCDPAGNCTGSVSTPKTLGAAINKPPGGSWTISRTDPQAWTRPNGGTAPADLVYKFAPGSLAGSITVTKQRVDAATQQGRLLHTRSQSKSASIALPRACAHNGAGAICR